MSFSLCLFLGLAGDALACMFHVCFQKFHLTFSFLDILVCSNIQCLIFDSFVCLFWGVFFWLVGVFVGVCLFLLFVFGTDYHVH